MIKPCLIIVFNHRYDQNISVLEELYKKRFSNIYFLVPFYNGCKHNVIPVYESSFFFQSYFAQAYSRFYNENFSHYIFIGDDCIMNPRINEVNFLDQIGLEVDADFIPGMIHYNRHTRGGWWHGFKGVDFFNNRKGAEIRNELPSREEAISRFSRHGIEMTPLSIKNIFGVKGPDNMHPLLYKLYKYYLFYFKWRKFKKNGKVVLPYPFVGAYCDFIIISKDSIKDFCHYCGVMASAGLFVELAIPTALVLTSRKICEEKDLAMRGLALWNKDEITSLEERYGRSLKKLLNNFPEAQLYLHPVKLSKWKNDL